MRPIHHIPNLVLFSRSPYGLVICPPSLWSLRRTGVKLLRPGLVLCCKRLHYCIPGLDCTSVALGNEGVREDVHENRVRKMFQTQVSYTYMKLSHMRWAFALT